MNSNRSKELLKMNPFKICPKCTHIWKVKDDFLQDPTVCLVGFQADFKGTEPGQYLFNHIPAGNTCNTTMAVKVDDFLSLYSGPMFEEIKFGSPTCEDHCRSIEDLDLCPVECKNAIARKIMVNFSRCKR
jgi:hypothetical protein